MIYIYWSLTNREIISLVSTTYKNFRFILSKKNYVTTIVRTSLFLEGHSIFA